MSHLIGETDKTKAIPTLPSSVTRFEVIDETGRAYVKYGVAIELSYQDEGRTLKVFVESRGAEAEAATKAEIKKGLEEFIARARRG